jgi:hypothetical protein
MADGLSIAQLWDWLTAGQVSERALEWAPDVAALTSVLIERSHAFRFVVSPPPGAQWPPAGEEPWAQRVRSAAAQWRAAMDAGTGEAPEIVRRYWATVIEHLDTPLGDIGDGRPWEVCEATLALHAIADEASAGCAGGGSARGPGFTFRARARELLARTGSLARLPADRVAQLPKSRTTGVGITHRSLSRYTCTTTGGIPVVWDRVPMRRRDSGPVPRHANVLLLPWPLRIRESDFVPVPGSVQRPEREPFGFFTYEPSEALDLDLVDRLLDAALEEVDAVDVVVLPEGCLDEADVAAMESLLGRRGVTMLVTGFRPEPAAQDRFAMNAVHTGLFLGGRWWHYRQNKHHRWFLDAGQIEAYNIAGALHPSVRWWEAMEIPERSVHFLELGGGITVAAVVCEDLARLDGVAELLRSVGPTLVMTLLLDGPQLASRWTSRYAGVLADDPGSAVLTLTALGMATRSQPRGVPPSRVIAMWKDPVRGVREIPMEPGSQAVLLKAVIDRSTRHAADGRQPVDDVTDFYIAGVHQLTAADGPAGEPTAPLGTAALTGQDLSVVSAWAQAIADAVSGGQEAVAEVLTAAAPDAGWRTGAGLSAPADDLAAALAGLVRLAADAGATSVAELRTALEASPADEPDPDAVARVCLVAALEATRRG